MSDVGKANPATESQKPAQVPDSQGPSTPNTSDNAKTVQAPPRGK